MTTDDTSDNTSDYTFTFSLLWVPDQDSGIQVWQSGTLGVNVATPSNVSGSISLPGFYNEDITFQGTAVESLAGTLVNASGGSSEVEARLSFIFNFDGFIYSGSLLGGMASILNYNAQETYLYIMQGFSPQGPFSR